MVTNFNGQKMDAVDRIILVQNGVIVNFIVVTPDFVLECYPGVEAAFISDIISENPDIGWTWTGGTNFQPPADLQQ